MITEQISYNAEWMAHVYEGIVDRLINDRPYVMGDAGIWVPTEKARLIERHRAENVIVNTLGKQSMFDVLTGVPTTSGFLYAGIGTGTTGELYTDTALQTELTGNANRYTIADHLGNPPPFLSTITQVDTSVSPYTLKLVIQFTLPTIDGNNPTTIKEAGLFDVNTFSPSGNMLNRVTFSPGVTKNSGSSVIFTVTIRI